MKAKEAEELGTRSVAPSLTPYVPRVLLRHLVETPDATWWTAEGSVVFVDISGFTKLSERLAKVGKEGAEQVTDAIEACFTDLLAVAYANDGSLIKFGGDALLLWFEDEDHVENACRSAVWMRRALRDVGRIEVPGSHVQLRMSVGINTGTYHFFHVGASHRELVVTGPGWTGTVSMEHVADAGEILVSPAVAAALPSRCVGEAKGPGLLLKREPPGHHAATPIPTYDVDPEAVAHCLSTVVRTHVLAGGGTPEHRQVTIAFVHFDGTDEAIEGRGPARVAEDLQALLAQTQAACDEFDVCFLGTDADDDGGKLILTAGAPTITGNDEERMLLALRRIADREHAIPIRIGVNKGSVFAGDIGPWYRRTYTVMGDAVNLAARLMAKATAGEIYATAEVLEASGTRFATTELEPFMVKGKAQPVQAWAVGEVLGSRTRDTSVQLPLIGRDRELRDLQEALAEAREGRGVLVEIVGEPGIGKSRLIEELHAEHEARVLSATAEAFTSSTPYVIWRELLRELIGVAWDADDRTVLMRLREMIAVAEPSLEPWLPLIAIPLDVDVPPTPEVEQLAEEFRQPKLHEVVGRFVAATLDQESLIHVEDAHLMDGASGDLFAFLLRDLGQRPWLWTMTRRDVDARFSAPEHESARTIRLGPLKREDVATLVEAATEDAPLLPHDVSLVVDRSGGNPQFALDLVQVVTVGGMLPESIETAAMARIDALAPADRALVRRASVIGVSFPRRFVPDVIDENAPPPDDETWERLSEFFVDDGDDYIRFRRAVVRDAAYSGLPFRTRRALHAKIAARFESEVNTEESGGLLSLHYLLAGDHAKAWPFAEAAAERAATQYAHQEAAYLFRRAIEAAQRVPNFPTAAMADLYERLTQAFVDSGDFRAAAGASSSVRRYRRSDPTGTARALLKRAMIESRLGSTSRALWWLSRTRSVLEGRDDAEARSVAASAAAYYASMLERLGRTTASARWGHLAVEEAGACGARIAMADAYDVLDLVNMDVGAPTGEYWQRALKIYEEEGDLQEQVRILANQGVGHQAAGRLTEAMDRYERAREMATRMGDEYGAALMVLNEGEIACDRGDYRPAEALTREALRFFRASEDGFVIASALAQLGRVLASSGRPDEALSLYGEAEQAFIQVGAQGSVPDLRARTAECHVLLHDPAAALDLLRKLPSIEDEGSSFRALALRVRGFALAQLGELEAAQRAFVESLAAAREREARTDIFDGLIAQIRLAVATGTPPAKEILDEVRRMQEQLGIVAVTCVPIDGVP